MSYCRWSSDYFDCDVYVYADVSGGWTTHVASRRQKHRLPDEIRELYDRWWESDDGAEQYVRARRMEQDWIRSFPHEIYEATTTDGDKVEMVSFADSEYIDLSEISEHAGQSYNHPTPGECADCLEEIRTSGLKVPQYAIDDLREDQLNHSDE